MSSKQRIEVRVNGTRYVREVEARLTLADFLRHELSLGGTHVGCDTAQCGACTVMVGKSVGLGDVPMAKSIARRFAILLPTIAAVVGLSAIAFRDVLVIPFNDLDPTARAMARDATRACRPTCCIYCSTSTDDLLSGQNKNPIIASDRIKALIEPSERDTL